MIVICTKCQAKFRVADDKIGPRGAKVRCSKCRTVFLVHPDLGTMPVTDGDARPASAKPAAAPRVAAVPETALAPPATPAPEPSDATAPPPSDPFAGADPFAAAPAPSTDPFAPAAPGPDPFPALPPEPDAFAAPPVPDPFSVPVPDPFSAPEPDAFAAPPPDPSPEGDPFAAPPAPSTVMPGDFGDPFAASVSQRSTLPVTDLSDLLGGAGAAHPPAPTPPVADAAAQPEPFGALPLAAPDASLSLAEPSPAPPEQPPAFPAMTPDDGGLALEDRLTPPPVRVQAAPEPSLETSLEIVEQPSVGAPFDPFAGFAPAPPQAAAFEAGLAEEARARAEALHAPEPAAPPAPPAPPAIPAPPRAAAPRAVPARAAHVPPAQAPERIPGARTSRLRAVAVNAVALVALVVVALPLWAVWRADGPVDVASLRPSAILAALGSGGASAGPWSAHDVRSGYYERERGAPVLFVRGLAVSHAPGAVRAVRVEVQVVREGQVVARGEALAGAVPTPEELYRAADDGALSAVVLRARARAPAEVRPGDAVPFLVAIGGAPPDLDGASLRIDIAPVPGGSP